ncbi:hypothetical protein HSX37_10835|uniref:Uncharacterized protein n=1 Tax=Dendrosporobacter quercicolus TaxID=146817 RepID=A0A1G9T7A6_9FIRM|nr:hypothetical protein [Dendrosporobacter quercicolus]NSL48526.1 hypothetical protein [Dendrosporobacter quercicolus DSM 1736]SDM43528.1 hypothetical protein SAMN04488502_104235 [Dendrosporobacter quercicolus]
MSEQDSKKKKIVDCSSAGKGFARTDDSDIAPENCPLPPGQAKGFARTEDSDEPAACGKGRDCSSAGKGFARSEDCEVAPEDCALPDGPGKGFVKSYNPKKN